jgi:hypothetical protein
VVVVLAGRRVDRGLRLEQLYSRAVQLNEIHEVISTDEATAIPGAKVNSIAYLGFVEIQQSGVLYVGDEVSVNGAPVGRLAGFDLTHHPNHLNLVVVAEPLRDGSELGLEIEAEIIFRFR